MSGQRDRRRQIPAVDRVAQAVAGTDPDLPDKLVINAVRAEIDALRAQVRVGQDAPDLQAVAQAAATRARLLLQDAPRPVINATGVIVHTNLGRAPLSDRALQAVANAAGGYSDLEFDVAAGQRGSRSSHISDVVREITGAEAALVLNNNAGAVFLALEAHAAGREVLVSRGEAIEIGGGFRIPDILRASGAVLRDVGTTNRTRVEDYAVAIGEQTAAILRVHRSNFAQVGFTESPALAGLAGLARERGLMLIDDLGSGSLLDTTEFGLEREPLVQDSLGAGATLVTFSGDKLLGGPQAGIIVGAASAVAAVGRRPLARALRPDKLTIAGLRATLGHYLRDEAVMQVPVWQMIAAQPRSLRTRARRLTRGLRGCAIVDSTAAVGGGSLPGQTLPSVAIRLEPELGPAEELAARLRGAERPVIGHIRDDRLWLDMRTVLTRDEPFLRAALRSL